MKTVILVGGFGTRLSDVTTTIPKPMVTIGGRPILWHIMRWYAKFEEKDFFLALGYKGDMIKDYFLHYENSDSDITVEQESKKISINVSKNVNWKVTPVDTGLDTMTGGRLRRMREYIGNETFLLTYGDGLADINIEKLVDFHRSHGKMITVTAVHPPARFGELEIEGDTVKSFKEKPQLRQGWINGGYFVVEPGFIDLIDGDDTMLEREPLEKATQLGELKAYRHEGFWRCMDTKRDRDLLEALWKKTTVPWHA